MNVKRINAILHVAAIMCVLTILENLIESAYSVILIQSPILDAFRIFGSWILLIIIGLLQNALNHSNSVRMIGLTYSALGFGYLCLGVFIIMRDYGF